MNPQDGDYILGDTWPLGSRTTLAIVGGKFIGTYATQEEAEQEIRRHMEAELFWPEVWHVDDHGGLSHVNVYDG